MIISNTEHVRVYIDDVVIHSRMLEEYLRHITNVLEIITGHGPNL